MQDNYVYMCTLVLKNTIFVIVFWFTTKQSTPNDVQLIITAPQIKQKNLVLYSGGNAAFYKRWKYIW